MVEIKTISHLTTAAVQLVNLTPQVLDFVQHARIKNGLLAVITTHTTTGIVVNEPLEDVATDIVETLERLVPPDLPYAHAHFLLSYGATGNNSTGHLKSTLVGNHCLFPLVDGALVRGGAQDIFLAEFDGPQTRKVVLELIGE